LKDTHLPIATAQRNSHGHR